ncbi:MAG: acyl-CoA dehydrogenase family protein [Syntrophomonadaceae bacterium]|jgi:butyryl-CoA dehydrogenase|nr:acyl-CoA dehydrogenase family protein [Syntrophomonadaceae bacterium]MDD3897834.1 acyl-CoA dehydrogenase family protein [Syntrophomonadaceae bacterium]
MDFRLSEEQEMMKKMAHDFAVNEIAPYASEWDNQHIYPEDCIKKMHEVGLMTIGVPAEYGGAGLDHLAQNIVAEEICWGDAGVGTVMVASTLLASDPVLVAANHEQKKDFYGRLNDGQLAAFCLTEPGAGSDVQGLSTKCVKVGDEYIINGVKQFISNGGTAGVYTLLATLDKKMGTKGMCAFIIDRDTPGITVGKTEDKLGIRTSNTTEVIFEDVRVPAKNLLGSEGKGFYIIMKTLDISRASIAAMATGVAQASLDASLEYSKLRTQFGKPICSFQAIQFKLADMAMRIEASRLLYMEAASLQDMDVPRFSKAASLAKAFAGDTAVFCATEAVQVFGGYGYTKDYPVEKYYRDAKIFQIYEGTGEVQRMVIAGDLLRG